MNQEVMVPRVEVLVSLGAVRTPWSGRRDCRRGAVTIRLDRREDRVLDESSPRVGSSKASAATIATISYLPARDAAKRRTA
jgi:hypothetical protein